MLLSSANAFLNNKMFTYLSSLIEIDKPFSKTKKRIYPDIISALKEK